MALFCMMPAIAYHLLVKAIIHQHGEHSVLAKAIGADLKGKISPVLYVAGSALAFLSPWLSMALYVLVAVMWLVPDRRIAKIIGRD
jgi:uncharacterized membrane protein